MTKKVTRACLVCSLALAGAPSVVGQSQPTFGKDAAKVFYLFSEVGPPGFQKGGLEAFEKFAASLQLTKAQKDEGGAWALYEGGNESGKIRASASFPDPNTNKNVFWVQFEVADPKPMPEALLQHLLAKSDTDLSNGDEMELKFPATARGTCTRRHVLTIRLTTGSLLSHAATTACPVQAR